MIMAAFQTVMAESGLVIHDPIIADGRLHRFHVKGDKPGTKNGWYCLFLDGVPSGVFGSWKFGIKGAWCAKTQQDMNPAERAEQKRRMDATREAREIEDQFIKKCVREKALLLWEISSTASDSHLYLAKKGVKNHGLRESRGALVIPLRDSAGILHSLQFIDGDGNKRFLSGGRKKGCYFCIGKPAEIICIAEGYATAASIHEATGHAVAVAFDAGNLLAVAQTLRTKFPKAKILLCADNDLNTPGNPGLTKANEAAAAVAGFVVVPEGVS